MTNAVNIIGGGVSVTAVTPSPDHVPAVTVQAPIKTTSTSGPTQTSSRLYDDPLAGVLVTEQLDSQGQVVSQTPPGAVLAYLRNGLTIDGQAKQTTTA
jgi:hypothetical protein